MNELLATLGGLVASLGNVQSGTVLRERIELFKQQAALAAQQAAALQKENADLVQRLQRAEDELAAHRAAQQFTQGSGALWRKAAGERHAYEPVPYCPRCRVSTSAFPPGDQFHCHACGWASNFTEAGIDAVLVKLPRS